MVPAARAALERLLAGSAPGGRVSLDAIGEAVGASAAVHPSAEAVQRLHDALSGAQSGLPVA